MSNNTNAPEITLRRRVPDKTLVVETRVHLSGRRHLTLYTSKGSRGLQCRASVGLHRGDGIVIHVIGFGGDFSMLVEAEDGARATEKNLRAVHQRAVDRLPDILALAGAHYVGKPEEA